MANAKYLNPPGLAPAQGLYSQAGVGASSNLIFVAGQLSVGSHGEVVGENDFDKQFHQIFDNLGALLKGLELDFNAVIKFTTFLTSDDDIPSFMRLRAERFQKMFATSDYPPNTLLIVKRLVKPEFMLEVEAIVGQ